MCLVMNVIYIYTLEWKKIYAAIDATTAIVKWKPEKIQAGLELEPLISATPVQHYNQLTKWNLPLVLHNIDQYCKMS